MIDRNELINVGNYAKKLREEIGITQKEMGIQLGVPLGTIQSFEYGRVNNAVLLYQYIKIHNGEL